MKLSYVLSGLFAFTLMSCGGGGGNQGGGAISTPSITSSSTSSQLPNTPPAVTIASPASVEINDVVTLAANATDATGSLTYSWVVEAGPTLTLSDSTKAQTSFTAPSVTQDTDVTLAVTVTNKAGASTKATTKITILSKKSALTINGLVTDGILANADVVVTIRDLIFKTKADSSGRYSINLVIDDAHSSDLVLIIAQGSETQAHVKLASLLPSVNTLMLQAGDDRILNFTENFNVNVTNVSTAEYALLTAPSPYGTGRPNIINDSDLYNALAEYGQGSKFYLAAVIKLIADHGFTLPVGFASTLDLAINQDEVNKFSAKVYTQDYNLIDKTISEIKSDNNVTPKNNPPLGSYILSAPPSETSGILTFNADFTGRYVSASYAAYDVTFSWNQVGDNTNIAFDVPLVPRENSNIIIRRAMFRSDGGSSAVKSGVWYVYKNEVYESGNEFELLPETRMAKLIDTSQTLKVPADKLIGEWFYENGNNVKFNTNGTAVTQLVNTSDSAFESTWSLVSGILKLEGVNRTTEFYLINDLGVGYNYVSIERNNSSMYVGQGLLIKSQENLNLTKSDLVGAWVDNKSEFFNLGNDGVKIQNYASWTTPWQFIEGQNTWGEYLYSQEGMMGELIGGVCNPVSKFLCKPWRTTTHKIIAQSEDNFYSLNKATTFYLDIPSDFFTLVRMKKLSSIKQFGSWISRNSAQKFYQQTPAGIKVWNFLEYSFGIADNSSYLSIPNKIPFTPHDGKLRYARDNVKRELELVSASETGLTVCEYNEGDVCVKGTEFLLSNKSPAKISLKVVGAGSIEGPSFPQIGLTSPFEELYLFGNKASFTILPSAGYGIHSVTGCNGKLSSNAYETVEIRESCTITATFVKNSN